MLIAKSMLPKEIGIGNLLKIAKTYRILFVTKCGVDHSSKFRSQFWAL
jgi:hypothetical protein